MGLADEKKQQPINITRTKATHVYRVSAINNCNYVRTTLFNVILKSIR